MSKWGVLKQARQRATRMEERGIITNASETFRSALEAIDAMNISRKEKTALKEEAATTYMESGYSTAADIHETFEYYGGTYLDERIDHGDTKSEAAFLGATENEKAVILGRHYLGSSTVQQLANQVGEDADAFYNILVTAVAEQAEEPDPDAIQGLINMMVDSYKEG